MDILIDIAAYNAFIVHRIKYPSEYKNQSNRERLNSLDNLCQELLDPSIKIRSEKSQKNHIVFFCQRKDNSTRYTDRFTKCDSSVCHEHSVLYCINCK